MGRESNVQRAEPKSHVRARAHAREQERERLRLLASKVQNEEHWATILDSCPTPEDRDSLEREVAPLLPWRRCGSRSCETHDTPCWLPVLLLRSTREGDTGRADLLLRVCTVCRERITVEDVLTDEVWTRILSGYLERGARLPVRSLTTLTFDAVQ